jgi:hypothetical protein
LLDWDQSIEERRPMLGYRNWNIGTDETDPALMPIKSPQSGPRAVQFEGINPQKGNSC